MFKQSNALPMAAGVAAAVGGAGATADPQVTGEVLEARLETQIWTAYALSPYLRAFDLKVAVRQANATLTGVVADEAHKDLARQIAISVDGIQSVENGIEVTPNFVPPVKTGDRAFGELVADTTVTSAVRSKLAWSRFADGLHASVTTARGRVTLTGSAIDAAARDAAGKLAMSTHGVYSVDNQLRVEADKLGIVTSIGAEIADTWINMKVKSTFLYSTYVAGRDITVTTQGGNVKLEGRIESETERSLAIELAGNVRGVKSVDSSALTM
ncbi:MAG: transport-associated protein [Steroidobacteraceae bacterium]|jgi:osmotically-inducible protein OsmY|nr:transport-associated protein [Steroidobacteraceae bacterium]